MKFVVTKIYFDYFRNRQIINRVESSILTFKELIDLDFVSFLAFSTLDHDIIERDFYLSPTEGVKYIITKIK